MTVISKDLRGTKRILTKAVDEQKKENDSVFLIGGIEGSGKSNFLLTCIATVDEIKKESTPITTIARNLKEFIGSLPSIKKAGQVSLDEGAELSSSNHYDPLVKALRQAFVIMRQRSIISFICFTNPSRMDTYFREDRVKGIFIMKKRGVVYFYAKSTFLEIYENLMRKRGGIKSLKLFFQYKPDLVDTFQAYNGPLLAEYLRRKEQNISTTLTNLAEKYGPKEKMYSFHAARDFLKIRVSTLREYVIHPAKPNPKARIPATYSPGFTRSHIKESDLLKFKEWYDKNAVKDGLVYTRYGLFGRKKKDVSPTIPTEKNFNNSN